jgi:HK97 family phage prohead protease
MNKHFTKSEIFYDASAPDTFGFTLSEEREDRDGDLILVDGIDVTQFLRNPVALGFHDNQALPIGKWTNLRVATVNGVKCLRADLVLALGLNPLSDQMKGLIENGFLNATSIGFRPLEYEPNPSNAEGHIFRRIELLEASIVNVPANAGALRVGKCFKSNPHLDGVFPDGCDTHGDPDDYLDIARLVTEAMDAHDLIRGDKSMNAQHVLNRAFFRGVKAQFGEITADRLKSIFESEFAKAAAKSGFAKLDSAGGAPGPGQVGQTIAANDAPTGNELTPDRIRAILQGQGFDAATIDEIMGLIGADIASGANLSDGANVGGTGPAGQPVTAQPQLASFHDQTKNAKH